MLNALTYIGIDPGVSGGIAWVNDLGNAYNAIKMPDTAVDVLDLFERLTERGTRPTHACIEKVNAGVFGKPGQRMGVVSAFTFGRAVERLHVALLASRIPYDEALPVKWQTTLGCRTRGDKNISKARAQQLFPHIKVTHAIADALLIAEFCRRLHSGKAAPIPAGGLFDGKEDEGNQAEGKEQEFGPFQVSEEFIEAARAAQATAGDVQRDGAAARRPHRERRARLRRSS